MEPTLQTMSGYEDGNNWEHAILTSQRHIDEDLIYRKLPTCRVGTYLTLIRRYILKVLP